MYAESLMELYKNDVVRPKIRARLHSVCQRALTAKKLTAKLVIDWVIFNALNYHWFRS